MPDSILYCGSSKYRSVLVDGQFFSAVPSDCSKEIRKNLVAPADGRIVVIEEVDEHEYFHDRRLMISIFMDITNVHANWYPVDGVVKHVDHHNGRFMKAWLPKASTENERSMVVIETPEGHTVMARQIAGAVARRIVTYAVPGEDCYIDEHMGFIKFWFASGCVPAVRYESLRQHGAKDNR